MLQSGLIRALLLRTVAGKHHVNMNLLGRSQVGRKYVELSPQLNELAKLQTPDAFVSPFMDVMIISKNRSIGVNPRSHF